MKEQEDPKEPSSNTLIATSGDTKFVRKNVYLCNSCGGGWVSADMDVGVTPFMDTCVHCGDTETFSLFYRVPQNILAPIPARVEWYKPDEAELAASSPPMREHAEKGGLFRRLSLEQFLIEEVASDIAKRIDDGAKEELSAMSQGRIPDAGNGDVRSKTDV